MYYSLVGWRFFTTTLLLVLVVVFRWYFGDTVDSMRQRALLGFIGAQYLLTLAYLIFGRIALIRQNKISVSIQLGIDLLAVAIVLIFSGGIYSQFWVLYSFVVIVAAGILDRTVGTIVTLLATMVPTVLATIHWFTGYGLPFGYTTEALRELVWRTAYNTVFLIVGAAASQFLGQRSRRTSQALVESEKDVRFLQALNNLIVRNIPSGLLVLDEAGQIVTANQTARDILGPWYNRAWELFSTRSGEDNQRFETDPASGFDKIVGYTPVPFSLPNHTEGILILFQDLTPQRRLEERLREEEKLAAVGRLGANLAHEIRNPLAGISNAVQLLHDGEGGASSPMFRVVEREMARLEQLVNDFLTYSRPAPLSESIFNPPEEARAILAAGGFQVRLECSPDGDWEYSGHRSVFIQVLYNLLQNARQWANPTSPVIWCTLERLDSGLRVIVEDNGPGLRDKGADHIWEPFSSHRPGGSGLGLAIVANLMAEIGGRYRCSSDSRLGGARFELEFGAVPDLPVTL